LLIWLYHPHDSSSDDATALRHVRFIQVLLSSRSFLLGRLGRTHHLPQQTPRAN
jgi:hypothetical protein